MCCNFSNFVRVSSNLNSELYKSVEKMKIRTITFFILSLAIIVFSISCLQSPKKNKEKNSQNGLVGTSVSEDFKSFLENFSQRPTFQRQRVLFPVVATVLDPSDYGMKTVQEKIEYQDWFLLDFSYDSTYSTRQMDRYNQNIRLYEDSAMIEHRGIDNGIFANYFFIKRDGKWFLESFTDASY